MNFHRVLAGSGGSNASACKPVNFFTGCQLVFVSAYWVLVDFFMEYWWDFSVLNW